jgi:hypothetical protein
MHMGVGALSIQSVSADGVFTINDCVVHSACSELSGAFGGSDGGGAAMNDFRRTHRNACATNPICRLLKLSP